MTLARLTRRSALTALAASALPLARVHAAEPQIDWQAHAADVRAEFQWAWRGYVAKAWGKDEINPVSGTATSFFMKGHDLGLSLVEALDTLWIMGLDAEFQAGVDWVKQNLDFDVDGEVQVFETNIRLVGGLLSAHLACGDPVLLAKAKDLADRLLKAFDASPHGLPWRYVNLRTGAVRDPETNLAEIGTYITEFGVLGRLTGERRYFDVAKRAMKHALERRSKLGLMAANIDARTGEFNSRLASIDVYADSFYEYLWDAWELFGDADCKRWAQECATAQLAHQAKHYDGRLWFPMVDFETGAVLSTTQSELAAYYAGLLAQVGRKAEGDAYLASFTEMQSTFGVIPESIDVATRQPRRLHTGLRPEYPDACLNLWLVDRDERYRRLALTHYQEMKATSRAAYGYTALKDISTKPMTQGDNCPGYWWSEQMKYYYLLFSDTPRIDYATLQLSTEANVLRGFRKV